MKVRELMRELARYDNDADVNIGIIDYSLISHKGGFKVEFYGMVKSVLADPVTSDNIFIVIEMDDDNCKAIK
jgi:hypothetical protein